MDRSSAAAHAGEHEPAGLARVEEAEDVGVLQVGGGLDFGEEALGAGPVVLVAPFWSF
jgi:hypothetical protein